MNTFSTRVAMIFKRYIAIFIDLFISMLFGLFVSFLALKLGLFPDFRVEFVGSLLLSTFADFGYFFFLCSVGTGFAMLFINTVFRGRSPGSRAFDLYYNVRTGNRISPFIVGIHNIISIFFFYPDVVVLLFSTRSVTDRLFGLYILDYRMDIVN